MRWQNGAAIVCDGPFAETKEQLGGIGLLKVRDMIHAVELMPKHPGLRYGATFEIRPIDASSAPEEKASGPMRKPFDILAEGLDLKNSRGDWIRTSDLLNPIQAR